MSSDVTRIETWDQDGHLLHVEEIETPPEIVAETVTADAQVTAERLAGDSPASSEKD